MPIRAVIAATLLALVVAGLITALNEPVSADFLLVELRR
jgi:hypothetical protein